MENSNNKDLRIFIQPTEIEGEVIETGPYLGNYWNRTISVKINRKYLPACIV